MVIIFILNKKGVLIHRKKQRFTFKYFRRRVLFLKLFEQVRLWLLLNYLVSLELFIFISVMLCFYISWKSFRSTNIVNRKNLKQISNSETWRRSWSECTLCCELFPLQYNGNLQENVPRFLNKGSVMSKNGCRNTATPKIDLFATPVNDFHLLNIYHKDIHLRCCRDPGSATGISGVLYTYLFFLFSLMKQLAYNLNYD